MKLPIVTLLLLFTLPGLAQPALTRTQASTLIGQALTAEPLMWLPFPLPYELESTRDDLDRVFLEALLRQGMVERENTLRMIDIEDRGQVRKKVQAVWVYRYPGTRAAETPEGFYYGRGKLLRLVELSAPYLIGEYYYAEAYIEWGVDDLQPWVNDPAFRAARTLRRSRESLQKPFEKRVYLQFDGQRWGFWQGLPGQL